MKYDIVKFTLSKTDGQPLLDDELMQTGRDIVAAMAGEAGFESFEETPHGIDGYIQTSLFSQEAIEGLAEAVPLDIKVTFTVSEAEDKDWNETWENEGFTPIVIGKECVIHDMRQPYTGPALDMDITIDAKMSFGTGTHATTRMVVAELLRNDLQGKRVLDCGCGTGILSIVASKRGASKVVGYDIDEWSVANTLHNAELNRVYNVDVLHGDIHVLSHINGLFDVIVANINRNVLLADMADMKDVMHAGALLVLSGFYNSDSMMIAERAGKMGLSLVSTETEDDWCCLTFRSDS
jgi:ribosomal protein L11 methyltransferase